MKRKRLWFLEPKDEHTNGVFASELDQYDSAQEGVVKGGRPAKVWRVSESQRDFFLDSRASANLHFNVLTCLEGDLHFQYAKAKLWASGRVEFLADKTIARAISVLLKEKAREIDKRVANLEKAKRVSPALLRRHTSI